MSKKQKAKVDPPVYPCGVGFSEFKPTLCIGLDVAWFGGSKSNRASQYDFLAATLIESPSEVGQLIPIRIPLPKRDPNAKATFEALQNLIDQFCEVSPRIVLAVDAPIQANNKDSNRPHVPSEGSVEQRACETYLSDGRKKIDEISGGSCGWQPNIQPGAPLPERVKNLVELLTETKVNRNFELWTADSSQLGCLVIECFPAEAIWAANRLKQFPEELTAPVVKAYKELEGCRLTERQVRSLVETAILIGFRQLSGIPTGWDKLVEKVISWMLRDEAWKIEGFYRGGKMLDDVVDSMICLATALSYATNNAHVWQDPKNTGDGHIIGPGRFNQGE